MKKVCLIIFTVFVVASIMSAYAQSDSTQSATTEKKYQAKAPKTQLFGKEHSLHQRRPPAVGWA